MWTVDDFAIECADGTGITLYVSTSLPAERWRYLRRAVDQLPATVRVLRVQLIGDAWRELPAGLGDLVRYWREVRQRPVHLNLAIRVPRCRRVDAVDLAHPIIVRQPEALGFTDGGSRQSPQRW